MTVNGHSLVDEGICDGLDAYLQMLMGNGYDFITEDHIEGWE